MASFQSVVVVTIAAIMAIAAHAADGDNCGGECVPGSAEFCGLDDQCHIYSCQAWYEFGPRNYTGYDGASPTPLTCQDIQVTEPYGTNTGYPSVSFRCSSLTPSPIAMGFTRRCTTSGPNIDFTCYELATGTDFQPFLDKVGASGLNCTDDDPDKIGYPKFQYRVTYESYPISGFGSVIMAGSVVLAQGHNLTSEFNETLALNGTMYASYRESTVQPTAAPTESPTSSPTLRTSSAFSNKRQTISIGGTLLGVTFLVSICL